MTVTRPASVECWCGYREACSDLRHALRVAITHEHLEPRYIPQPWVGPVRRYKPRQRRRVRTRTRVLSLSEFQGGGFVTAPDWALTEGNRMPAGLATEAS